MGSPKDSFLASKDSKVSQCTDRKFWYYYGYLPFFFGKTIHFTYIYVMRKPHEKKRLKTLILYTLL